MPHAYTEDQLVEQPAIGLFAELGWTTVSASEEAFGAAGNASKIKVVPMSEMAKRYASGALDPQATVKTAA